MPEGGANAILPGMIDTPIAVDGPGLGPTFFEPAPDLVVRAGLFDGVPGDPARPRRLTVRLSEREGALGIAEIEQRWGQGEARLGAWAYSTRVVSLAPRDAPGLINRGPYAFVEGPLAAPDEDGRLLDGWLRVGVAEARVNPIARYVGGGIVRRGIWSHNDALGLAVAHAVLSDGMETSIEANYARSVSRRLIVQPTVQVIHNPGSSCRPTPTLALVIGARLIWRSDG